MFLKIMSDEDAPDSDTRKTFRLLDGVDSAHITRGAKQKASIEVLFKTGEVETFDCPANAYLMNDAGDTVAKFGAAPLHRAA